MNRRQWLKRFTNSLCGMAVIKTLPNWSLIKSETRYAVTGSRFNEYGGQKQEVFDVDKVVVAFGFKDVQAAKAYCDQLIPIKFGDGWSISKGDSRPIFNMKSAFSSYWAAIVYIDNLRIESYEFTETGSQVT